jgi:dTDP-6-deoxy-L-talose 4-dehydrogenase (NAD+)
LECLKGTITLAQAAVASGVRRFIGIGTCFEYDLSEGYLTTKTPLSPSTPYAAAKASVYSTLSQWLPQKNVEFCWCRLFYLYGENEDQRRLVPYLRSKLAAGEIAELTSGKQIRDFLDVTKAGEMITKNALSNALGAINICSGIPITVRQLAENIAAEYNRQDLLRFGVRSDNLTDPSCVVGIQ